MKWVVPAWESRQKRVWSLTYTVISRTFASNLWGQNKIIWVASNFLYHKWPWGVSFTTWLGAMFQVVLHDNDDGPRHKLKGISTNQRANIIVLGRYPMKISYCNVRGNSFEMKVKAEHEPCVKRWVWRSLYFLVHLWQTTYNTDYICVCLKWMVLFHHMDHHRNSSEHLCNIFMIGLLSAGATLRVRQTQQSFWSLC